MILHELLSVLSSTDPATELRNTEDPKPNETVVGVLNERQARFMIFTETKRAILRSKTDVLNAHIEELVAKYGRRREDVPSDILAEYDRLKDEYDESTNEITLLVSLMSMEMSQEFRLSNGETLQIRKGFQVVTVPRRPDPIEILLMDGGCGDPNCQRCGGVIRIC